MTRRGRRANQNFEKRVGDANNDHCRSFSRVKGSALCPSSHGLELWTGRCNIRRFISRGFRSHPYSNPVSIGRNFGWLLFAPEEMRAHLFHFPVRVGGKATMASLCTPHVLVSVGRRSNPIRRMPQFFAVAASKQLRRPIQTPNTIELAGRGVPGPLLPRS